MKIFSIIVTYNGMRWYDRCLGSLRNSELPVETIVIDNASSDDSVNYIKANFPEVHLIESNENLGFAKANNQLTTMVQTTYSYSTKTHGLKKIPSVASLQRSKITPKLALLLPSI